MGFYPIMRLGGQRSDGLYPFKRLRRRGVMGWKPILLAASLKCEVHLTFGDKRS